MQFYTCDLRCRSRCLFWYPSKATIFKFWVDALEHVVPAAICCTTLHSAEAQRWKEVPPDKQT